MIKEVITHFNLYFSFLVLSCLFIPADGAVKATAVAVAKPDIEEKGLVGFNFLQKLACVQPHVCQISWHKKKTRKKRTKENEKIKTISKSWV
jgi:hypothetical protein